MIRTIEELSMNAWPAIQSMLYDGWVLRSADGYTKRANSVYPLYPSEINLDEKIKFCASFYRTRGLPAVFKMTQASTPADLDSRLDALGYHTDSPTSVQTLDLKQMNSEEPTDVDLTSDDTEAWHESFARMNNVGSDHRATHENILRAIMPDRCYASISMDGNIIGCGLSVLQAGYLGIFDIVVDLDHRGHGHGTHLMQALLAWGKRAGANASYLQVMCNNQPALRLYEKLGFLEKYQYWYRIKA
jgi:ribosomal protein S18 acetylase RimI-like enzyme